MAEILFGKPSLRLNLTKAVMDFPIHHTRAARLQYMKDIRAKLDLDSLLRRNNRQISVGPDQYRDIPHWKVPLGRMPGLASPNYIPLATERKDGEQAPDPDYAVLDQVIKEKLAEYQSQTSKFDFNKQEPPTEEQIQELKQEIEKLKLMKGK